VGLPAPARRAVGPGGAKVAASTVWEILREAGIDPSPDQAASSRVDFLRSQADALLACDFGDDQAGKHAALPAYYGFFSLFPLLLAFVTVLGYAFANNAELQQQPIDTVIDRFPGFGPQLQASITTIRGSGVALAIGVLGTLWDGWGSRAAPRTPMNAVSNIPYKDRPNWRLLLARSVPGSTPMPPQPRASKAEAGKARAEAARQAAPRAQRRRQLNRSGSIGGVRYRPTGWPVPDLQAARTPESIRGLTWPLRGCPVAPLCGRALPRPPTARPGWLASQSRRRPGTS
jgi:Virulence factor BrkB